MKLGKLPAEPRASDLKLLELTAVKLPMPQSSRFGHGLDFGQSGWGMLGNDNYGDCVWAEAAHGTMLYNHLAGRVVNFTEEGVLSDYAAVTGFDPEGYDPGTNMREAMSYRRKTGVIDSLDQRHKIDAYASIDAKDWDTMIACVYTFGAVAIGFEFPDSAWDQIHSGQPWDVVNGATIEGGHDVLIVGSMGWKHKATCITWGQRQELTKAFYQKYNDETWVPLSLELIKASGLGPHHLDEQKLKDYLGAL